MVRHHAKEDLWVLPGGRVEFGENIRAALQRELTEELGVQPKIGHLLYVYQFERSEVERVEFHFHISNSKDYADVKLGDGSHSQQELAEVAFKKPDSVTILQQFITRDLPTLVKNGFQIDVQFEQNDS